jgi:uncharacterized protein (DUF362 family)
MKLDDVNVSVNFTNISVYPTKQYFHPDEAFPEYDGNELDPENKVYGEVRKTLFLMGLDRENFGKKEWNPFKDIVKPGMTVFMMPNIVRHTNLSGKDIFAVIIHGSVFRPILDYVLKALEENGKIICGLSQVISGDFDRAMKISGIGPLLDWKSSKTGVKIEYFDLRTVKSGRTWLYGNWGRPPVNKDPLGYQWVDLGDFSHFKDIDPSKLRIAIGSYKNMYKHHSGGKHEYLFPKSVLSCDAIISIPKLKTHRRTAVTMAIKNHFGLPASKESLPHWICGSPEEGGDQYMYPSVRKKICTRIHDVIQSNRFVIVKCAAALIKKIIWSTRKIVPFKDPFYEGMWWGNDTLWRTQLDINRAFFYSDKNGVIRDKPQRNYFVFVDGITAGEGDGPVACDPLYPGVLSCAFNPVVHDAVGATLMGFDIDKIKIIKNGLTLKDPKPLFNGDPDKINVYVSDKDNIVVEYNMEEFKSKFNLGFKAQENWKGHVERNVSTN